MVPSVGSTFMRPYKESSFCPNERKQQEPIPGLTPESKLLPLLSRPLLPLQHEEDEGEQKPWNNKPKMTFLL